MIALLLLTHFVADFLLQPRVMARKKSSEIHWLMGHLLIQFACFLPFGVWFSIFNSAIHGLIDWYIWRGYKWAVVKRLYDEHGDPWIQGESKGKPCHSLMSDTGEWKYWDDDWFYKTIGLDQLLHGLTIVLLWSAM